MISGLDLSATVDYVLKDDTDNPTVWKLGIIPTYLFARISSQANKNEIDTAFKILQVALKGWINSNVPYETKKENLFDRELDVVPLSTLERFPIKVIGELSMKVMEINQLTDGERKN